MHLARGLTTINTKKRKQKKLTKAQQEKLMTEWKQHNKDMRRKQMHSAQFEHFEDYVAYTRGEYKPKPRTQEFKEYKPDYGYMRGSTQHIPSAGHGVGVAAKRESQKYTGTLIKGIATMHKSNAVPVIDKEQATDIANMRRN